MNIFHEILVNQLAVEGRFISDEGELKKFVIIDAAFNMDRTLIGLLLTKKELKQKFFTQIAGHWVFDINLFVRYMENKNFLKDSYTRYRNKIGLTINGKFAKQSNEVALVWPFKDCILEGGQTEEDQKRPEIFFNEILAQEEIDQLTEPKVLVNWERYTTDGTQKVTDIKRGKNGIIKENLIIKGNNLLGLHSLLPQFENQVKLIYIDPPYNTGNDAFKYNDSFNHSTWLTFMKNRLEVARRLLRNDGVIFVQISDYEIGYLNVLLDEVFGRENFVNKISIKTKSPSGFKTVNLGVFETAEYILFYGKNKTRFKYNPQFVEKKYDTNYSLQIDNMSKDYKEWTYSSIKEYVASENGYTNAKEASKQIGKNNFIEKVGDFALKNSNKVFRFTEIGNDAGKDTIEKKRSSIANKGVVFKAEREGKDDRFILNGKEISFYKKKVKEIDGKIVPTTILTNIWTDIAWEGIAKEGGISLKKGKKPEKLLKRLIDMATKKGDIVLDFFGGSGTTGAVAHKMNRQYILIEQMNYIKDLPEARLKKVIGIKTKKADKLHEKIEFDISGVSKALNWKGGGSFIYTELKQYNQTFINQIEKAETENELIAIWEEMKIHSFLNYNVDIKKHDENIEEFKTLEIKTQKNHLIKLLNKNQLYVNLSSIDDEDFKVSDENKKLTNDFYEIKEEETVTQTKTDL